MVKLKKLPHCFISLFEVLSFCWYLMCRIIIYFDKYCSSVNFGDQQMDRSLLYCENSIWSDPLSFDIVIFHYFCHKKKMRYSSLYEFWFNFYSAKTLLRWDCAAWENIKTSAGFVVDLLKSLLDFFSFKFYCVWVISSLNCSLMLSNILWHH